MQEERAKKPTRLHTRSNVRNQYYESEYVDTMSEADSVVSPRYQEDLARERVASDVQNNREVESMHPQIGIGHQSTWKNE